MTTISAQLAGPWEAENGAAGGGAAAEGGDAASLSSLAGLVAEVPLERDAVETQPRPPVEERGVSEAAGVFAAVRRVLDDLVRTSQPGRSRPAPPAAPPPTAQLQCRSAGSPAGPGAAVNGGAAAGGGEETAPPPGVGAAGSVQQRAERKERKGQVMDPARPFRRGHFFGTKTGPTADEKKGRGPIVLCRKVS
jgi:hypothetical protein